MNDFEKEWFKIEMKKYQEMFNFVKTQWNSIFILNKIIE